MGGGNMAREAAQGDESVEHLAGKALEALSKKQEEPETVEELASRALKQMDGYKSGIQVPQEADGGDDI